MSHTVSHELLGNPYQDELQVIDPETSALIPLSASILATRAATRHIARNSTSRRKAQDPMLVPYTPGRAQLPAWGSRLQPGYYGPRP